MKSQDMPGDPHNENNPQAHHEPTSNRLLLSGFIMLAVAMLAVIALLTVGYVRLGNDAASQSQLRRLQADSCPVFQFVEARFLVPTKTETAAQKQITTQFAGRLQRVVADCAKAGYR